MKELKFDSLMTRKISLIHCLLGLRPWISLTRCANSGLNKLRNSIESQLNNLRSRLDKNHNVVNGRIDILLARVRALEEEVFKNDNNKSANTNGR